MKEWELRLNHDRDYRDILCKMNNIPIPKDEPGSMTLPKQPFTKWKGKEFWPKFEAQGHTSLIFSACKCSRGGI